MARSCLFICDSLFAVSLKRNFNLPGFLYNYGVLNIHMSSFAKQKELRTEKIATENHRKHEQDDLKITILKAGLDFVLEHGWTEKSLALGVKSLGLSPAVHTLIEGGGPEMVNYFSFQCNLKLEDHLKEISSKDKKLDLQEFITEALEYRLRLIIPYVPRWSEAMALMVLPTHFLSHASNMLQFVDSIWHFYGDKSLDMSWYGKRLALLAAYKASELSLVQDKSSDFSNTFEFLHRRVENVIETGELAETVHLNLKQLPELAGSFFITARNLLGLRKLQS